LCAFVKVDIADRNTLRVGRPQFFTVRALRDAVEQTTATTKANSEGRETWIAWPSWSPKKAGQVAAVHPPKVKCTFVEGRPYTYTAKWPASHFYLAPGETFGAGEMIVAGAVAPAEDLDCHGDTWDIAADLASENPDDLYAAVKAARAHPFGPALSGQVEDVAGDEQRDWRVRLEALATLACFDAGAWTEPLVGVALDLERTIEEQIEATFILSEIPTPQAAEGLYRVAQPGPGRPSAVRAAAAWGLGQGSHPTVDRLLDLALDEDLEVAFHAVSAVPDLPDNAAEILTHWLELDDRKAATAAQLLLRHNRIRDLFSALAGHGDASLWALRALGDIEPDVLEKELGNALTDDLRGRLRPLWMTHRDWLRTEVATEELSLLDGQKIAYDPLTLNRPVDPTAPAVEAGQPVAPVAAP
jgi:hypothetical protein